MKLLSWTATPQVAIVVALTVAANGRPCPLSTEIIAGREVGPQEKSRIETYDDLLVRVEKKAPGFGGMFIDSDGRLAVYLRDRSQLPAARSAIESVFGSSRVPAAGMRSLQGQYAVSQLK